MANSFRQLVRTTRAERGWSQEELARRSGLSRAEVSAIETGRVVPSTAAALELAAAFGCRVEDLFRSGAAGDADPVLARPIRTQQAAVWRVEVGGRLVLHPVEHTLIGALPADGLWTAKGLRLFAGTDPAATLALAGCDPAVGLLAAQVARSTPVRLLPLKRSSREALEMLGAGLVHAAGLHLQEHGVTRDNERLVREMLGPGYKLLRVATWQEGVALAPGLKIRSISAAAKGRLRWVSREEGSGARSCLDKILASTRHPRGDRYIARDHTMVAEAIRSGWAQAGVCVRLSAAEAGLDFLVAREEDYDLCYRADSEPDPRIVALIETVRSRSFSRALCELPGYHVGETGDIHSIGRERRSTPAMR